MNPGMTAKIFLKYGELSWEDPLVKIAKSYHNGVASLYIMMRNLIIIRISSKEIVETRNFFQNCKFQRYLAKQEIGSLRKEFP